MSAAPASIRNLSRYSISWAHRFPTRNWIESIRLETAYGQHCRLIREEDARW